MRCGELALSIACVLVCCCGHDVLAEQLEINPSVLSLIDQSQVAAEEAGVLVQIDVEVGRRVDAGTLLARLDDRDARLELDRARIELQRAAKAANDDIDVRSAKESLALAELDLKRARESISRYAKSVSDAQLDRLAVIVARAGLDVDRAERDLDLAKLLVEAARNGVATAERSVERRRIVAPIAGTVVAVDARLGEWVDAGKQVFRIVDVNRLRAEGFIELNRLVGDIQGREAVFTSLLPGGQSRAFHGLVTFVTPEVNRVNGQVRVWAEIDNRDRLLRPGMTGTLATDTMSDVEDPARAVLPSETLQAPAGLNAREP
jgi:RND family efflux transporter MFP subunit